MTTSTFEYNLDGDLNSAAEWDSGVPDATIDAIISTIGGSYTADFACKSLIGAPSNGPYGILGSLDKYIKLSGNVDLGSGASQLQFNGISPWVNFQFDATGSILGTLSGGIGTLRGRNAAVATLSFDTLANVAIDFNGASTLNANSKNVESLGNMALGSGGITNMGGKTVTVGGNFSSTGNLVAASSWNLNITGSKTLSPGITITNCQSLNAIDATGCTDGGGNSGNITFGAVAPTVSNVTSAHANGTVTTGEVIDITVQFSASVDVTGTPKLTLSLGAGTNQASYLSGSGSDTLTFRYTVIAGNTSADLDYAATNSLILNSGTINATSGGAAATLTLASPGAAGSLGANKAIVVDTTAPTVSNVTSAKTNGSYPANEVIDVTVQFSESVTVTGTPQLSLALNAGARLINYLSGSGSNTLTFRYTVQAGDTAADLDYSSTGALTLNGGTILDGVGIAATLTLPAPAAAGSLGANKALVIDTSAPSVSNVTSTHADGTVNAAGVIDIQVVFTESVTVTGTPQITVALRAGGSRAIDYLSGSGTATLLFRMTVAAPDATNKLDYTSTSALALNGGTIKDAAGNNAGLTLVAPGAAGSIGANKDIQIDTQTSYQVRPNRRRVGLAR